MASPMDNEIQFLGSKALSSSSPSSTSVSAIVLTEVPANTSPSQRNLTFTRATTPVVHIGRSGMGIEESKAAFASSVISRNHAKITFADSGSIFIIDTNSHHGTWIIRSGDQTKLTPESPYQLQDGDKITFGKEVDKDGIFHQPISVNVKLLYSLATSLSSPISKERVLSEHPSSPNPPKRFGIQISSESENSDAEESDHVSVSSNINDMNELPPKANIILDSDSMASFEPRHPDYLPISPSHSNASSFLGDVMEPHSEDTPLSPELCPSSLTIPPLRGLIRQLPIPQDTQLPGIQSIRHRLFRPGMDIDSTGENSNRHEHHHHGRHFFHHRHIHHRHNDESSTNHKEFTEISERVDALVKEVENLKEKQRNAQLWDANAGVAKDTEKLFSANLQKLRESVTIIQSDMTTMKSHKVGMQTDIRFLRADDDARKEELKDLKAKLTERCDEIATSVKTLGADNEGTQMILFGITDEIRNELYGVQKSFSDLEVSQSFEKSEQADRTCLINLTTERLDKEIGELRASLANQGLTAQMKEDVKNQIRKIIEEYNTSPPVLGKRRREDTGDNKDETVHQRRAKHFKFAHKLITATVVGALSAWVGLAFW